MLSIIVSHLSETLRALWARKQDEAGISLSTTTTEHKYNPCVGLLQLGLFLWIRNFIGLPPLWLLCFHNVPTVYATLRQEVMGLIKKTHETVSVKRQLGKPHPEILTFRPLQVFLLRITHLSVQECLDLFHWALKDITQQSTRSTKPQVGAEQVTNTCCVVKSKFVWETTHSLREFKHLVWSTTREDIT